MKHRGRALLLTGLCLLLSAGYLRASNAPLIDDWRASRDRTADQLLYDRLTQQAERVYLLAYELEPEEFFRLWDRTKDNAPELFFVAPTYEYQTQGDTVLCVHPQYLFTGDELTAAQADYDRALDRVVAEIDSGWTDAQTALYLHDWVALHSVYDETMAHFTAYDLLTGGTGVCQAYAQTYQALLTRCGIPCRAVTSEEMNHAWVTVSLDGAWYNVDVTHDDPTFDRLGHVQHTYFLKSDEALRDTHSGGDAPYPCVSDTYDRAVWDEVDSAFIPVNGTFYCISGSRLCRWDDAGLTPLYTVSQHWYVTGDRYSYWDGCFSALATDGDDLLLSTPNAVMRYDLATGAVSTACAYDGPGAIYGFTYADGIVTCQVADNPNEPGETVSMELTG